MIIFSQFIRLDEILNKTLGVWHRISVPFLNRSSQPSWLSRHISAKKVHSLGFWTLNTVDIREDWDVLDFNPNCIFLKHCADRTLPVGDLAPMETNGLL